MKRGIKRSRVIDGGKIVPLMTAVPFSTLYIDITSAMFVFFIMLSCGHIDFAMLDQDCYLVPNLDRSKQVRTNVITHLVPNEAGPN